LYNSAKTEYIQFGSDCILLHTGYSKSNNESSKAIVITDTTNDELCIFPSTNTNEKIVLGDYLNNLNTGSCTTYLMYQLIIHGMAFYDLYYLDGGLEIPKAGTIRIGSNMYRKIYKNIFLKID
jgi:hypothetical protein